MTAIALGPILLLIFAVGIVLAVVLICLLAGRNNKPSTTTANQTVPSVDPAERHRRREAILEKLAAREISREDAEQQLLELDKPLPEQMPVPPPKQGNGCGTGCLVAVIVLGGLLILFLLSIFCFRFIAPHQMHY